ncbi:C6 finger domain protein, putative [Paecilomyces variotii No. 5]|uniref:C6 finger domain protein, putative n=1 Tax=Byssochlamys spectabilis (strain No. 5 / NBRC 109023) TaxID=1356009 RepID=V5FZ33_BYSSN|nr:C6 finger domain protein, putative [Paecilomyces variotii No. 5]
MEKEEDVKVSLESHSSPEESKPNPDSSESHEAVPKNVPGPRGPKKRTKTGCLTCRKRRIKCGEEKPICNNCIKSKRECEGYAQRVIFKHPLGPFGGFQAGPLGNHLHQPAMRQPMYSDYNAQYAQYAQSQPGGSQHPLLAPRPVYLPPTGATRQVNPGAIPQHPLGQAANPTSLYYPTAQTQGFPPPQNFVASQPVPTTTEVTSSVAVNNSYQDAFAAPSSYQPLIDQQQGQAHEIHASGASQINLLNQGDLSHQFDQSYPSGTTGWDPIANSQMNMAQFQPEVLSGEQVIIGDSPEVSQQPKNLSPSQILSPSSGYNDESDDYYDVDSDEEMSEQTQIENFNQLNLIMASARQDERLRSFTTHLNEPNVLASYRPSMGSSPLNNPKTARIFLHFIHSTGPSISIWERHPTNASIRFGSVIPPAHQGLWTYTLPIKALEHPALLQAILAISSLHIAKLQDAPPTVSLKHYHYALKKVGTAVGLPMRRKQIATLAATLLLGFYEVTAGEHHKWNSHVAGSSQLIREIDFAGLTRDLRAHRRRVRAQREQEQMAQMETWPWYDQFGGGASEDDPFCEKESEIDENLISLLMGRVINYDEFGRIEDGNQAASPRKHFTKKDIENYRIQSDLYWWYTKQDLFQSLISGNRLFTPYDQWGQCPPRAGIGRLDAVYGSMDHLMLLLGRLADFAYRDRKRKVRSLAATGGEWMPTPEFFKFMARFGPRSRQPNGGANGTTTGDPPHDFARGPPGVRPPQPSNQQNRLREDPPMYGMVPPTGPVRLPSAFAPTGRGTGVVSDDSEDSDTAETPYHDAESEWEDIAAALDLFVGSLGPEYMPLSPDIAAPIATPFGPALQYRTHTIAVLWAYYYLGRILLNRLHPCMPPATMVAAGVAASTTVEAAQTVGKIIAGIYHPQQYNFEAGSLNPTLGGALTEITVPIFFAGVQYIDAAQRGWTVSKLTEISRLTGWQTSFSIAVGCESAWVAAAKKGRGPPYEFTTKKELNKPENDVHDRSPNIARKQNPDDNIELRFTTPSTKERLHFAQGLLGLEEDILTLEIEDRL